MNKATKKTENDNPSIITCYFRDGNIIEFDFPDDSHSYCAQLGLSATQDGKYIFIPVWEGGLYCYETQTGNLVWIQRAGKIGRIIANKDKIFCARMDVGIEVRAVLNWDLIGKIPCTDVEMQFQRLDEEHFVYRNRTKKQGPFFKVRFDDLSQEIYQGQELI